MQPLKVINMTNLLKKEILIYSLGDFRLSRPMGIGTLLYTAGLFVIWSLPIFMIFGIAPTAAIVALLPPLILGSVFAKPIWSGKTFLGLLITIIKYQLTPKMYCDNRAVNPIHNYLIDGEMLVSRKDDFQYLFNLVEQEVKNGYNTKK